MLDLYGDNGHNGSYSCNGYLVYNGYFSFGLTVHGVDSALCGTCPACTLGLDLTGIHGEWCWIL